MRRLTVLLILLVACGQSPSPGSQIGEDWVKIGGRSQVREVTLSDGTRCVVLRGSFGRGGIDCEWGPK